MIQYHCNSNIAAKKLNINQVVEGCKKLMQKEEYSSTFCIKIIMYMLCILLAQGKLESTASIT